MERDCDLIANDAVFVILDGMCTQDVAAPVLSYWSTASVTDPDVVYLAVYVRSCVYTFRLVTRTRTFVYDVVRNFVRVFYDLFGATVIVVDVFY